MRLIIRSAIGPETNETFAGVSGNGADTGRAEHPAIDSPIHPVFFTSTGSPTMNTLVASTLNSFLFRRVQAPERLVAVRVAQPAHRATSNPWAAETRPVVFRSEAFAEDLEEDWAS